MMQKLLLVVSLVACMPSEQSEVQSGGDEQLSWFKTPEEIKATIEGYGIDISPEDRLIYFDKLSELYGGKNIRQQKVTLVEPNGIYLLALDALSNWLSCQLIVKEKTTKEGFTFRGGLFTTNQNCDACYADDNEDWCDCDDQITLDSMFADQPTSEQRKRIMHNIQDIGDFLNIAVDNELLVDSYQHAADYLYQEVFLANRSAEFSCLAEQQISDGVTRTKREMDEQPATEPVVQHYEAWRLVIHAILMSGPFYLNVNNRE